MQSNPDVKTKQKTNKKSTNENIQNIQKLYVYARIFFCLFFALQIHYSTVLPFKICYAVSSGVFKDFLNRSFIQVVIIVSQSPQANGHIERMVQMTKDALQQIAGGA